MGDREAAVRVFNGLRPYVAQILELQAECEQFGPDDMALAIALDGLQTAAFHFTRRHFFYFEMERRQRRPGNGRLNDPAERIRAMEELTPCDDALRALQGQCSPFRRDWMALDIARQALGTTAFHFTGDETFFGGEPCAQPSG
jgi:hypothetical protein